MNVPIVLVGRELHDPDHLVDAALLPEGPTIGQPRQRVAKPFSAAMVVGITFDTSTRIASGSVSVFTDQRSTPQTGFGGVGAGGELRHPRVSKEVMPMGIHRRARLARPTQVTSRTLQPLVSTRALASRWSIAVCSGSYYWLITGSNDLFWLRLRYDGRVRRTNQ